MENKESKMDRLDNLSDLQSNTLHDLEAVLHRIRLKYLELVKIEDELFNQEEAKRKESTRNKISHDGIIPTQNEGDANQ